MNPVMREELRELASHWAHVLVDDRHLSADAIDRLILALRAECEVRLAGAANEREEAARRRAVQS